MAPTTNAPVFGGKGEAFPNEAKDVELWTRVASLELIKSASALIVNMAPVVREVCSAVGSDQLVPDDYFAPYATDSIY